MSHDKTANSNLTEGFPYCDLRFCINDFHCENAGFTLGANHISSKGLSSITLMIMIMIMIVNITFIYVRTPVKLNADERDIQAFEKMAANFRARSWRP